MNHGAAAALLPHDATVLVRNVADDTVAWKLALGTDAGCSVLQILRDGVVDVRFPYFRIYTYWPCARSSLIALVFSYSSRRRSASA